MFSDIADYFLKKRRPRPTKELTYVGRRWMAAPHKDGCLLWLVAEPEHMKGRCLYATAQGVWECSRDGKDEPVGHPFDPQPDLLNRFKEP